MTVSKRWTVVKKDVAYQRQSGSSRLNISHSAVPFKIGSMRAVLPLDVRALSDPVMQAFAKMDSLLCGHLR
jgi:hypothetical protein